MSENIHDNKFKEELEKELESGFHGDSNNADDDDFTVRVKREEYVVKRRFYDKDKALEAAETLRQDKQNFVEDNIEGQAFAADEDDETVDWDKLVDSGLEFDPPIAHAAEKPPGEPPVGLSDHEPDPQMDDKVLEKTLLVKRPKKEKPQVEEVDEDVEFDGEEEQEDDEASGKKSRMPFLVLALLVLCVGGGAFYYFSNKASQPKSPPRQAVTTKKINASPMPARPVTAPAKTSEPVFEKPAVADKPVRDKARAPVPEPPVQVEKTAPVLSNKQPATPVTQPEASAPAKKLVTVEDHFTHTVHVSSYRKSERAMAAVVQLEKKGFDAFIGTISIPGKGEWYRVYAGYLKDLDSAVALSRVIKKETREDAVARKAPTAIQVGDIAPLSQLKGTISELKQKGYAANAVPVSTGSDMGRILIGAFKSDSEAATMLSLMKKDGFIVKTVLR